MDNKTNLELVDELRKRTNCSYEEAKTLLEKHNYNIVEAVVEYEKSHNVNIPYGGCYSNQKNGCGFESTKGFFKRWYEKGKATRFIIANQKNETVINISMNIFILSILLAFHFVLGGIVVAVLTKCKIRIKKAQGDDVNFDKVINDVKNTVKNTVGTETN